MKVLSLGSGRQWKQINNHYLGSTVTHVDNIYSACSEETRSNNNLVNDDVFHYLESYPNQDYNEINSQRFFEHIPTDKIHYLLYLLYSVAAENATIRIVVPDLLSIAETLSVMDPNKQTAFEFDLDLIKVSTELYNEISDPHQSPWTIMLARYYLELENYWKIESIDKKTIDGRNWYIEIIATKCQTEN